MDLLDTCRKLLFAAAVDDRRLGAQPFGRAHGIHRHVAAADHDHTLADIDRGVVRVVVGARQEFVGRNHAVEVLARNAHEAGKSRAGADEYGVVPLLAEQRIDGDGAAHDDIGFDLHAEPLDFGDLARHDALFGQTEFGNAVDQYASHLVQGFEYLDSVTHFRKVAGAGQSRRAAADDGDPAAVARCGAGRRGAVFEFPVAYETFEFADGDRFALDAQNAGAFALRFLRADAAADRRQRTVFGDDVGRLLQLAPVQGSDKVRDADIDRTGRYAAGIFALQAARCFERRLFEVVAVADLLEVGRTYFRVLFAHGDARYLVCHCSRMLLGV